MFYLQWVEQWTFIWEGRIEKKKKSYEHQQQSANVWNIIKNISLGFVLMFEMVACVWNEWIEFCWSWATKLCTVVGIYSRIIFNICWPNVETKFLNLLTQKQLVKIPIENNNNAPFELIFKIVEKQWMICFLAHALSVFASI